MTLHRLRRWFYVTVAIMIATAGAAHAQELASEPELLRVDGYQAVGIFNQHLYLGTFSRPRAIAVDREQKEIWVADTGNGIMSVHDLDGVELYAFTSEKRLHDPARLTVAPGHRLVVIEGDRTQARVFNYRGQYLSDLSLPGMPAKPILGAIGFAPDGMMYVADHESSQIFVYDTEGKLKLEFGSHGTDEGQFMSVCAIAFDAQGNVYVADQLALAVQVFDRQGNFLRGWGRHEMGGEHVSLPSGIAVDSKGNIFVSDELRHQVKMFSNEGKLLLNIGGLGDGPGMFSFPTDVAIDADDRIYVSERTTSRIQILTLRYSMSE